MFRYIFFVFMPMLILFLEAYEKRTAEKAGAGDGKATGSRRVFLILCIVFSLLIFGAVVLFYHGAELGSVTDHGLLYLAMQFGRPARPVACVVLLVYLVVSLLILIKWPKRYLLFFMIVWVVAQGYNNYASYQIYLRDYATQDDDDIFELRDFVYAHQDQTFLIVDTVIPADQPLRRSDTYLDTPNILHTSVDGLNILFAAEDSVDLTRTEIPGRFIFTHPEQYQLYDATEVDYLLLSNSVLAAPGETYELLDVGEGDWYRLYALEDPATLGYIATFDHPSPGTYTFLPQAFSTQYGQDYVSGEEPAYLLYGPFGALDPGHYTFTIEYEYTGDALPGERVGSADVVCSELGMAAGPVPVEVGESSVRGVLMASSGRLSKKR